MITVLEYATLSWHTYHPFFNLFGKKPSSFQIMKKDGGNHALHGWHQITDISRHMHPAQDFYAQLYVKFAFGKPLAGVVAFRGTVITDWDNDKVDFNTWASDVIAQGKNNQIPKYFTQAEWFYHDSLRYLFDELKCHHLSVTGHSLGGAIAQLIPGLLQMPSTAISFNSPGIGHIPGVEQAQANCIHAINSTYGFINKIGKPLGHITYVDVPEKEPQAKQALEDSAKEKNLSYQLEHTKDPTERANLYCALNLENHLPDKIDFFESVGAQHSIGNLLKTLHEKKYGAVAGQGFI